MTKLLYLSIFILAIANAWVSNLYFNQQRDIAVATYQKSYLEKEITHLKDELAQPDWVGYASWYGESDEECLGCREDRIMANGEVFDETALTVAFNRVPLGTVLLIRNPVTSHIVYAEVSDTGGFEPLGRIIDLSKAVKEYLDCTDLCYVEIYR